MVLSNYVLWKIKSATTSIFIFLLLSAMSLVTEATLIPTYGTFLHHYVARPTTYGSTVPVNKALRNCGYPVPLLRPYPLNQAMHE